MKEKPPVFHSKVSLPFIALLLILVSACGQPPAATPAAGPTNRPTATMANPTAPPATPAPSATPTAPAKPSVAASPTPSSFPALSGLALKLQDLPSGFQEISFADLGISEQGLRSSLEIESAFAFRISTATQFETIQGFATSLPARMRDTNDEERLRSQTNTLIDSIAKGYAPRSNTTISELAVPERIGDIAAGRTFLTKFDQPGLEKYAARTDIVVFQRNIATVILLVEYVDGFTPAVAIGDVAKLLDQRIVDAFAASPVSITPKPTAAPSGTRTMGTPVALWDGLPVMPGATEGSPAGPSYIYSIKVSVPDAEAYYQRQMSDGGWKLADRQTSDTSMFGGPAVALEFTRGDKIADVLLVFSTKDNYTIVALTMVK